MKVLWFETSIPSRYLNDGRVVMGWQDSLEKIVRNCTEIELVIAFEAPSGCITKEIDGVLYIPICINYSSLEKRLSYYSWRIIESKLLPKCMEIINTVNPNLIHVFGNEWPFGLVGEETEIPVVIHIQGSLIPYYNALYPPRYSDFTIIKSTHFNPRKLYRLLQARYKNNSRLEMEKRVWRCVDNYMGRTCWDKALCNTMVPNSTYYHVEEAIRSEFVDCSTPWQPKHNKSLKLITTGIHNFWKGPDMLLKTARILSEMGVDYEWNVAGAMHENIREATEMKEQLKFKDYNINLLGPVDAKTLQSYLLDCTMYVHTAYIENSPNSICEAQLLGVPVVSTYVGGIDSLVRNNKDGLLVPANDPWRMADAIVQLANNNELMVAMAKSTYEFSHKRHDKEIILTQLLNCYSDIVRKKNGSKN